MSKDKAKGKCPECKEEVYAPYLNQVKFCSLACETNFRYRMSHRNPMTNQTPDPEDVRRW